MISPNTILQNRYCIVRELGHGGMGTVYEAIDRRLSSKLMLKFSQVLRKGGRGTPLYYISLLAVTSG